MRFSLSIAVLTSVVSGTFLLAAQQVPSPWVPCDVTVAHTDDRPYGNELLKVYLYGNIEFRPGGSGFQTRDGALGMKFGWERYIAGNITVTGHRLDADALHFRANSGAATVRPDSKPAT